MTARSFHWRTDNGSALDGWRKRSPPRTHAVGNMRSLPLSTLPARVWWDSFQIAPERLA